MKIDVTRIIDLATRVAPLADSLNATLTQRAIGIKLADRFVEAVDLTGRLDSDPDAPARIVETLSTMSAALSVVRKSRMVSSLQQVDALIEDIGEVAGEITGMLQAASQPAPEGKPTEVKEPDGEPDPPKEPDGE